MTIAESNYNGTVLTFWQLLEKANIEIPIIQRDYAQGRKDKKELRSNFLQALYECLENDLPIKLDFIYGSVENGSFQPLDGQQRLTTLFLLHWYAAKKINLSEQLYVNTLKQFSYETRVSSREFCTALIDSEVIFEDSMSISDQIIDSSWFFLSWKKDPTIEAMLIMLDDIHQSFFKIEQLWEKLVDEKLISFFHVDLEDIGLTDDLYIKMNARGKLLSPFENFKASFQKRINENNWEKAQEFEDTFASKIDTSWTDLFWTKGIERNLDQSFMRFISTIVAIRQSVGKSSERLSTIGALHDPPNTVLPSMIDEDSFDYLCECFDLYSELKKSPKEIELNFPLFRHTPDKSILSAIVYEGTNASYSQKVFFFAQTEYLLRNPEFNKVKFGEWMRVIRNILCRGDISKNGQRPDIIRSTYAFDGGINLISELAEGSHDIYLHLRSDLKLKSTFARHQVDEEILKAKHLLNSDEDKSVIFKTEDTPLLQGRITFALYCIDIANTDFDRDKLQRVNVVIDTYLNDESNVNNKLRRALLTIDDDDGNYGYYNYWWSKWNLIDAEKRCLIDRFREIEFYIDGKYKNNDLYPIYFKKLINRLVDSNLDEIIESFVPPTTMPNWKTRLIKEGDLLNSSDSNYIAIPEDNSCCYLLKSMRPRDIEGSVKIE
ncbi:MAG: hypothetical protein ACJASQ_003045 [Crocinitomicaceae bacterium]|jgi:hypothetical protein